MRLGTHYTVSQGDWCHVPIDFPAVLFDEKGYVRFRSVTEYRRFVDGDAGIKEYLATNTLTIVGGISTRDAYQTFPTQEAHPEEITDLDQFAEGATTQVNVNRFERNPSARRRCLEAWGVRCAVCYFDFESHYGLIARGFIHVHHLKPLSSIRANYRLDAVKDLRPVCPNCHAVIHKREPQFSLEEVRALLAGSKNYSPGA